MIYIHQVPRFLIKKHLESGPENIFMLFEKPKLFSKVSLVYVFDILLLFLKTIKQFGSVEISIDEDSINWNYSG